MNLPTFRWLLSPEGQAALAAAATLPLTEASHLADLDRLRRQLGAERAAATLETTRLRRRATAKFALAERMYFTAEALEQASGETVAAHLAGRLRGYDVVADLGCGIGGDCLALARQVRRVIAVDRDSLRLAMARANLAAHGLAERVRFICADITDGLPPADATYVDPSRRANGRRRLAPAAYQPDLGTIVGWARTRPALVIKAAPGLPDEAVPDGWEVEFVAVGGELKEALLWHGPLRSAARRASLLPAGLSLSAAEPGSRPPPVGPPAGYLYEPNPAIIRAHLLDQVAERIGGWQIDPTIAYLCAPTAVATPLARCWPIDEWLPFNLKALRRRLRELAVGAVVVKKRGSPIEPSELERRLRLEGPNRRIVVLTRVAGRPAIILCHEA